MSSRAAQLVNDTSSSHSIVFSGGRFLMEGVFSRKNIERYHKMLVNPRDEDQRRIILKLLAEEEAKLKEFSSQRL